MQSRQYQTVTVYHNVAQHFKGTFPEPIHISGKVPSLVSRRTGFSR